MRTRAVIRPANQDVYNHLARVSADQQLALILSFSGRLDESRLRVAVAALLCEQPVLGCRFHYDGGVARFTPGEPTTRLRVRTATQAGLEAQALAAQPLDYSGDGVFRVDLVRDGRCDVLVVRIDHVAADGQGAKQVVASLAACYRSADQLERPRRVELPDRSAARLLRRFAMGEKLRLLRSRQDVRPAWGLPIAAEGIAARHHEVARVDQEQFSLLRTRAKDARVTVNDLVLAAFYRALFTELSPKVGVPMAINVSVDLRRYLDASDPMPAAANLSGTETAMLPRLAGESFAQTLERTAVEMARLKADRPGLAAAVLLEYASRVGYSRVEKLAVAPMLRGRQHGVSFPFLSNFGVLDPEALCFGDLTPVDAVVLPPVGHPPFMMLSPSSYAGRLNLVRSAIRRARPIRPWCGASSTASSASSRNGRSRRDVSAPPKRCPCVD